MSRCIKRFILTFVLLAGLCESMTITVYAVSSEFTIDRNGVLTGYHGVGGNVIVPDGVVSIGKKAFSGCNNVVTVKLPSSVKTIEEVMLFDVYDAKGKQYANYSVVANVGTKDEDSLDKKGSISQLPKGTYYIRVKKTRKTSSGIYTIRLEKEK